MTNKKRLGKLLELYKEQTGETLSAEALLDLADDIKTFAEDNLLTEEEFEKISRLANSFFALCGDKIVFRNRRKNDYLHFIRELTDVKISSSTVSS